MQPTRPGPGPAPAETPTMFAELEIQVGPAQQWGTARGRVPPDQANHLISAFVALGNVTAGITGAVLTLRISPGLTGPAYAELAIALVAALLTAVRGQAGRRTSGALTPLDQAATKPVPGRDGLTTSR
jgi:hypothetical protein